MVTKKLIYHEDERGRQAATHVCKITIPLFMSFQHSRYDLVVTNLDTLFST
jgi:hypothetical protein